MEIWQVYYMTHNFFQLSYPPAAVSQHIIYIPFASYFFIEFNESSNFYHVQVTESIGSSSFRSIYDSPECVTKVLAMYRLLLKSDAILFQQLPAGLNPLCLQTEQFVLPADLAAGSQQES